VNADAYWTDIKFTTHKCEEGNKDTKIKKERNKKETTEHL
jgi:hypothetical protein